MRLSIKGIFCKEYIWNEGGHLFCISAAKRNKYRNTMNVKNNNNIVNSGGISVAVTFFLLMTVVAAKLPQPLYAASINYIQSSSGHEQYKIKQVADDNAFSNLSRTLTPPTEVGNATSSTTTPNSTGITDLVPHSGVGSSSTGNSIGSISTHHRASLYQPHHQGSVSSSHSINSSQ